MKRPSTALLFLLALATTVAAPPESPQRVQLDLTLTDGSRLIGVLADPDFALETRFGEVTLAGCQTFRVCGGGESIALEWEDGDRLRATLSFETIAIDSVIGRLDVPVAVIERGTVQLLEPAPPLAPVAVRVSGQYAHHKTEYAYDGEIGQGWSSGAWGGWIEFDLGEVCALGRIATHLQFYPPGAAVHEVYVSDEPIGTSRDGAQLVGRFSGHRKDRDVLAVECGTEVRGRYVQVFCPSSRSWFNVRELEVFARD